MNSGVRERIEQIEELGLPPKTIEALRKLWTLQGTALVEPVTSDYVIRPRLAKAMEKAGLIRIAHRGQVAYFDDLGSDMAFDLFGHEDEV